MKKDHRTKIRIAAGADLHVTTSDAGKWKEYFSAISEQADVLVVCGDMTHSGSAREAAVLGEELQCLRIPVIGVLGNHDHAMDRPDLVAGTLRQAGLRILEGDCTVVKDTGFAGVKGFGGGFGPYSLAPFGEAATKAFAREALEQTRLLDEALEKLDTGDPLAPKVALMHYAPIQATVAGEPEPLYPFLGSSRLSDPLVRRRVAVAFHGHAHSGTLEGQVAGVKVFNVARDVLVRAGYPWPFFLYEI